MQQLCVDCAPEVKAEKGIREARLKPEAADHYPRLPVHVWTSAATLARLVAAWVREQHLDRSGERILVETDFEFRGGLSLTRRALRETGRQEPVPQ